MTIQKYSHEITIPIVGTKLIIGAARGHVLIQAGMPQDMDAGFKKHYELCKVFSMTSLERMYGLYKAVEYIEDAGIPGDCVECGVWRGGSMMMVGSVLNELGSSTRTLWLYDTFAGMTKPTANDNVPLDSDWGQEGYASLKEVLRNMASIGYPALKVVKGDVLKTIPGHLAPTQIALLRLDTDWYESTKHELEHLFPLLVPGGVLIIDDYGHFAGARQAVDEYFGEHRVKMMLNRIDYTCRIGVKA